MGVNVYKKYFFLNKKCDRIGGESDKTPPPPAGTPPREENYNKGTNKKEKKLWKG